LAAAVRDAGWPELRDDDSTGSPIAGSVEATIVVEALGAAVADVACSGPLLAGDLARRAGVAHDNAVVAFAPTLVDAAPGNDANTHEEGYAVDCGSDVDLAYVVVPDGKGYRLALARIDGAPGGADLTRAVRPISVGADLAIVPGQQCGMTLDDLAQWRALGLALT